MSRESTDAIPQDLLSPVPTDTLSKNFFDLPNELRQQIYDYVIPVCRLAPFPYLDAEWQMKTLEHRGIPEMVFASRKLYEEVVPHIYSNAILEIAPVQHGHTYFNIQERTTQRVIPYGYSRLSSTFRFYRPEHLKLIRKAHVFSNQTIVVDGGCYEALLQWLIEHTNVEHIELSTKPMTRIRGSSDFDLSTWRTNFHNFTDLPSLRLIRIWTKARRPPWEYEKMMKLRCKATDGTLNPVQIYFYAADKDSSPGGTSLHLDPRWLTRLNDGPEKFETLEQAVPLIDGLMSRLLSGKEWKDYNDSSRHFDGEHWVYQMIVVRTTDEPS